MKLKQIIGNRKPTTDDWHELADKWNLEADYTLYDIAPPGVKCKTCWDLDICAECLGAYPLTCPSECVDGRCTICKVVGEEPPPKKDYRPPSIVSYGPFIPDEVKPITLSSSYTNPMRHSPLEERPTSIDGKFLLENKLHELLTTVARYAREHGLPKDIRLHIQTEYMSSRIVANVLFPNGDEMVLSTQEI